ncbi:hypothetical protein MHA_2663 [Mannheimia haemolytica PHL213]|nr:hypothetical protein MHA_2663 [Mannheimia haemolytica PHL213]
MLPTGYKALYIKASNKSVGKVGKISKSFKFFLYKLKLL